MTPIYRKFRYFLRRTIRCDTIYRQRINISIFSTKKYVAHLSYKYDLGMYRIPVFETRSRTGEYRIS